MSIFGGSAWHWDPTRMQYYMHNFLASQPDLNLHNPEVQDVLFDMTRFWLKRGVDGFRLDTINFYFHDKDLRDNPALEPSRRNASTAPRSEEHTSELQSLMRISYAVFCWKKTNQIINHRPARR